MKVWAIFFFLMAVVILFVYLVAPTGHFEIIPTIANAEITAGDMLVAFNQSGLALVFYDKSLDLQFDNKTLVKTANAEINLKRMAEANQIYDTLLQANKNATEAIIGKGDLAFKSGNYSNAIPYYDKALSENPKDASTWIKRGDSFMALSLIEEKKMHNLYKNLTLPDSFSNEGSDAELISDVQVGNYQEALASYQEAMKYAPTDAISISMRVLNASGTSLEDNADILKNL